MNFSQLINMVKADSHSNDRQKPDTKFIIENDQADSYQQSYHWRMIKVTKG